MKHLVLGVSLSLAAALTLSGCGGSSATSNTSANGGSNPGASPTVVSVGDAPMSSVLAAQVTISAVSFAGNSGNVSLLAQPRTIELTHLGGIRAPLVMHPLPQGTYSSVSVTVSAAQITYIDSSSGQPVTATATIPSAQATQTITLNPALTVSDSGATDLRFDFDLQQSLDLTGSTVTFTPVIGAAVAHVKDEDKDARRIHVDGTVTATDATAQTLTLTTDEGLAVTLNITNTTAFDDNLTLAGLTTGTAVETVATLNADGSLTALSVEDADAGTEEGEQGRVAGGIITGVTRDSQNQLTGFTLVVRNTMHPAWFGQPITVQVNNATLFKDSLRATAAGLATYDQSSIFAGQGAWVAGAAVAGSSDTMLATEVRPAAVNPFGLTSGSVTATAGGFAIPLLLDAQTNFAHFANLSALVVETNAQTVYDGNGLTATTVANLAVGSPLVARGFLAAGSSGDVLFCDNLHEEGH